MSQTKGQKVQIRAYGIKVLLSRHPRVRRLKRLHFPSGHGNKFWTSSWLLMDFFHRKGLPARSRVMDVGCGWGLAGIYCAKKHDAVVTAIDTDPEIFPFLQLHAEINGVQVATMKRAFGGLTHADLGGFDVLIGADICFWETLTYSLKRLINRALRSGIKLVLIADPGRPTFDELAEYFMEKQGGKILNRTVHRPRRIQGRILKIGSIND